MMKMTTSTLELSSTINQRYKYHTQGKTPTEVQRDELINDMVETKRKAKAFDEIKEYTLDKIEMLTTKQEFAQDSNDFEYFGNLLTAFKAVKYKISDLERGIDGHN